LYTGRNQQTKEQGTKRTSRRIETPNVSPDWLLTELFIDAMKYVSAPNTFSSRRATYAETFVTNT